MATRITNPVAEPAQTKVTLGSCEYRHCLVVPGRSYEIVLREVGSDVDLMTLGPWTAEAKVGKNAIMQVCLNVSDVADREDFEVAGLEEPK